MCKSGLANLQNICIYRYNGGFENSIKVFLKEAEEYTALWYTTSLT